MKRIICMLILIVLLFSLAACSVESDSASSPPISAGYLPLRIEQINSEAVIPDGGEATASSTENTVAIESLWGEWVLRDTSTDTNQYFTYTVTEGYEEPLEIEFSCFPDSFNFKPDYITSAMTLWNLKNQAESNTQVVFGEMLSSSEIELERNPLGLALSELNLGFGTVTFSGNEESDDPMMALHISTEGTRAVTYTVSGDVLSVGLTDVTAFAGIVSDEVPDQTAICEIDYTFSWTGSELTLSYNGMSAVYVPAGTAEDGSWDLDEAGVPDGVNTLGSILGITLSNSKAQVMYNQQLGYSDSEIDFQDDGTVVIDGNTYSYYRSSESLTLANDNGMAVYSNYTFQLPGGTGPAYFSFVANGNSVKLTGRNTVSWFSENGFETSLSLNQPINSGIVTDAFFLSCGGTSIQVKACNPYDTPVPLGECIVCYILIDDTTGIIEKGDSHIGSTTYEQINSYYEAPYEKKPDTLRYKATWAGILTEVSSFDKTALLDLNGDKEVVYTFESSVLSRVELLLPSLLYCGLQDNVGNDTLSSMDVNTMVSYIETRDSVLDRLKAAFEQADVEVEINEDTGEIVMSSSVLFGFDSYTLSDEGKHYIDSFMGVYASVILDDSLAGVISEVCLEGHTDSNGSYDYNLQLSEKRAQAVLDYCLSSSSTSMNRDQKERLNEIATVIGYSFSDLVYDENGNEDSDASRRVAIKFYVTEAAVSNTEEIQDPVMGVLTADDFLLSVSGESHNALTELESNSGWYFYYDASNETTREQIVETARGIHIGDSVNDLLAAYGDMELTAFTTDNPFYSADDYRSTMLDDCVAYVSYWYDDSAAIYFFLDDWSCVSWIVYYVS